MKRWAVIAALLAGVISIALWALFFRGGSDDDAVRKAVQRTAAAVKVIPGENAVMRATRVRSELIATIAPDVSINIPELTELTRGRDALIGAAIAGAAAWERADITVSFGNVQLDPGTAFVSATATLNATPHGGSSSVSDRDTRRCSFLLEKRDGNWRIYELTVFPKEPPREGT